MVDSHQPLRIAVVGRSVYALHGFGGLERHLYDLVRHHLAEGWEVTLITRSVTRPSGVLPERWVPVTTHPGFRLRTVPYRTFPFAGRRGTTGTGPKYGVSAVWLARGPRRRRPRHQETR